ncbi:MAG: hypothetical protein ACI9CU_000268 [Polaribacter sp.]
MLCLEGKASAALTSQFHHLPKVSSISPFVLFKRFNSLIITFDTAKSSTLNARHFDKV